jgi:hypothetical protein
MLTLPQGAFGAVSVPPHDQVAHGEMAAQWRSVEGRVNSFTTSTQGHASVAALPRGGFVVVWESRRQEDGSSGIFLQRYDATGRRVGGELHANVHTQGMQQRPVVAADGLGGTWVAWESTGQDGSLCAVMARRFDDGFTGGTDEILVNEHVRGQQGDVAVAADAEGRAMFVWTTPAERAAGRRVVARVFDAAGAALTPEWSVSTTEATDASVPSVDVDGCGRFLVAWSESRAGEAARAHPSRILAGAYDESGRPVWGPVTVSPADRRAHLEPSIAADSAGGFAVAWMTADSEDYEVMARVFDAEGAALASARRIAADDGLRYLCGVSMASTAEGRWFVAFNAARPDSPDLGIYGQVLSVEGTRQGALAPLNSSAAGMQALAVAVGARRSVALSDGRFVVAWSGETPDDREAAGLTLLAPRGVDVHLESPPSPGPGGPDAGGAAELVAAPHEPPIYDPESILDEPFGGDRDPTSSGEDFGFIGITNTGWTPPDPHLAAGPNHVMVMTNGALAAFQKDGTKDFQFLIEGGSGFWGTLGAGGFVFDPEILYDPHANRFMAMACERTGGLSFFLFAVSDDDDPNGTWHKYRFDVTGLAAGNIDSPNMAVDTDAVYLTADFFGPDRYLIYILRKSDVLAGQAPLTRSLLITGQQSMGIPVTYDASAPQYVIESFENQSGDNTQVRFHAILDPLGTPQRVTTLLDVPAYRYPERPPSQGTSSRPTLFEPRFWSCVYRNGSLWAVHHVNSARVRARWYEFRMNDWPDGGAPELVQWGEIDPGDPVRTFFPSIWVDDLGNAVIVTARSSPTEFISMSRAVRLIGDPPGTFRPLEFVKQSAGAYSGSRWGDYSGTASDPARPGSFWGHHEYTPGGNSWNTWIAEIQVPVGDVVDPLEFEVTRGTLIGGTLDDLLVSDDRYVRVEAIRPTELAANSVEIEITTTLPTDAPTVLGFVVEAATDGDPVRQRIEMFNYDSSSWEEVDERAGAPSDGTASAFIAVNPERFIEAGTGEARVRVGFQDHGVTFLSWSGRFDRAYWTVIE